MMLFLSLSLSLGSARKKRHPTRLGSSQRASLASERRETARSERVTVDESAPHVCAAVSTANLKVTRSSARQRRKAEKAAKRRVKAPGSSPKSRSNWSLGAATRRRTSRLPILFATLSTLFVPSLRSMTTICTPDTDLAKALLAKGGALLLLWAFPWHPPPWTQSPSSPGNKS